MRVTALATVTAALLAACALAWPDATRQFLAAALAVAWRLHRNTTEARP